MKNGVLILGATSAIARAAANSFAAKGHPIFLAGRDRSELKRLANDIRIRHGVTVHDGLFDAAQYDSHPAFLQHVLDKMSSLDGALLAFGDMGDHNIALHDFSAAHQIIVNNYVGACSILTVLSNHLAEKQSGFLIGITSVAGDRGRQSNYVYGSAKGGLALFLQGLRNRLHTHNVHVMTVKPGFVDTAMTFGLPGLFLVAQPHSVGNAIVRALEKKKNVVYIPGFWRAIMAIIRTIPEPLFKRLKL